MRRTNSRVTPDTSLEEHWGKSGPNISPFTIVIIALFSYFFHLIAHGICVYISMQQFAPLYFESNALSIFNAIQRFHQCYTVGGGPLFTMGTQTPVLPSCRQPYMSIRASVSK